MTKPGYQYLLTYQQLEEIYDLTNQFCQRFLPGRENLRIREQMVHAARSAKQCLVEGYEQESLKSYIKLTGVSKGSLKELLEDYKDFARNHQVEVWGKGDKRVKQMLAKRKQRKQGPKWTLPLIPFHPFNPLYPVNYMLNLVNMTTYLLDRQIDSLKEKFIKEGGWSETIFKKRLAYRQKQFGFTLVVILIVLAVLIITAAGGVVVWGQKNQQPQAAQELYKDERLLNILPPKEKAELENAIRQAPKPRPTMPPVVPHSPAENQNLSPQEQEYYYRKYILKDPAFQ